MKLLARFVILIALVLCILAGGVSAQNMSISTIGPMGPQTIQLYTNGTLLGVYNTSTAGISLPDTDFQVLIAPQTTDLLGDPAAAVEYILDFLRTNVVELFVLALVLWLALGGKRR